MLLCALTLIGVSVLVTPWVGVGVLLAPFLLGALNVAGGDAAKWACMAMSAIPFVLVTSVHSVLVLLFAVATIDRSACLLASIFGWFRSIFAPEKEAPRHNRMGKQELCERGAAVVLLSKGHRKDRLHVFYPESRDLGVPQVRRVFDLV